MDEKRLSHPYFQNIIWRAKDWVFKNQLNTLVSISYLFKCSGILIKAHPYFKIIMGQGLNVQKS